MNQHKFLTRITKFPFRSFIAAVAWSREANFTNPQPISLTIAIHNKEKLIKELMQKKLFTEGVKGPTSALLHRIPHDVNIFHMTIRCKYLKIILHVLLVTKQG